MCLDCTVVKVLEPGARLSQTIPQFHGFPAFDIAIVNWQQSILVWMATGQKLAPSKPMTTKETIWATASVSLLRKQSQVSQWDDSTLTRYVPIMGHTSLS